MSTVPLIVFKSSKFTVVALLLLTKCCVTYGTNVTGTVRPRQQPSRAERDERQFQRSHPEIFVDTKMIPNGLEVSTTLTKGKANRYFFLVTRNASELNVRVTTCASRVTWSLVFMYEPSDDYDLLPDHSKNPHPVHVSPASVRVRPESVVLKTCNRCPVVSEYRSVTASTPTPGLYSLIFNTTRNTRIRLFSSTFTTAIEYSHLPYVPLFKTHTGPGNKTLSTDIVLNWKRNLSFREKKEMSLSYCVSANTRGHYPTLCIAQSALATNTTSPSPLGTGFPAKQGKVHELASLSDFSSPKNINDSRKLMCFSSRKRYRFHGNFRENQKYYFDLFAIDNITLTSVAFAGTSLTLPTTSSQPAKNVLTLNNGTVSKTIHLKDNTVKRLQFVVNETGKSVEIFVHVCGVGSLIVHFSHGRKNISYFTVDGPITRNLKFKAGVGMYRIMLRGQSLNTTGDAPNVSMTPLGSSNLNSTQGDVKQSESSTLCSSVRRSSDVVVIIQISVHGRAPRLPI